MNGHVGRGADGFEGVHGGKGCGIKNAEGEMLLEFADTMGLAVCNTWFTQRDSQKVAYKSRGCKTAVDYVLTGREERQMVSNVTVIQCEACITQHKLMICVVKLKENVRKRREVFVSKCRVWKLKEADVHRNFQEKINAKADAEFEGDVENLWTKLKERLLEVADEVCGRTKGPPRHRE